MKIFTTTTISLLSPPLLLRSFSAFALRALCGSAVNSILYSILPFSHLLTDLSVLSGNVLTFLKRRFGRRFQPERGIF